MTFEEVGVNYTIHNPEETPPEAGRVTFPALTLDNGVTMGQVPAMLNILGERFGLTGATPEQRMLCQQTVLDVDDIFAEAQSGKFTQNPERAAKWLQLLDTQLSDHKFLVSDAPTVADFHAVFATEWVHKSFSATAYDAFPRLSQWWKAICDHPPVHQMKTGSIPMIP